MRVFTVGFGSPEGEVVNFGGRSMRAQLDAPTLQAIAETTKGEYFEAQSSDDLARVYNSLSTKLISEKKLTEIAFIFAGIGALFALLAGALSLLVVRPAGLGPPQRPDAAFSPWVERSVRVR